jgi:hypothetical protein
MGEMIKDKKQSNCWLVQLNSFLYYMCTQSTRADYLRGLPTSPEYINLQYPVNLESNDTLCETVATERSSAGWMRQLT